MNKHKKHANLSKPSGGRFHRLEFGFIGAPCDIIQELCKQIQQKLAKDYSIGFIDADHKASNDLADSYDSIYTDKIDSHLLETNSLSYYQLRASMAQHDAVFVNGNHFKSDRQIAIINNKKKESLLRKVDRLNNIQLILLDDDVEQPFDFIVKKIDGGQVVQTMSIKKLDTICAFIKDEIDVSRAPITGLVYMGGRSERMGEDKSQIDYHGQPQYLHLAHMLTNYCSTVNLSVQKKSKTKLEFPTIEDTYLDLGPYGGLLSAFRQNPNAAILTLPCDAPFIDEKLIDILVQNRNHKKIATCFHNPETRFPEPLITIWEPRAYPILLQFLSMGYSCPRKVLINSDIEELQIDTPEKLFNANTLKEREWAVGKINVVV